jgi:hypothetical protein
MRSGRITNVHARDNSAALKEMKDKYGDKIYGRYGFADAFNPHSGWVNPDVIGIDLGNHAAQHRKSQKRKSLVLVHAER